MSEKEKTDKSEGAKNQNGREDTPLEGIRVIEYSSGVSGPYCGKILADLGAEVLKIEPPVVGDETRHMGPFAGDVPHPEKSGFFLYLNSNKRGITLNPEKEAGKDIFRKLTENADAVIEDGSPGRMARLGLGYENLKRMNSGLIMASITPFGLSGPYRNCKAYPLNTTHISGQGFLLPLPSPDSKRPPVKVGDHASEYDSGLVAAVAVLGALFRKGVSGKGQFIEISKQEALISMQRVESVTYANEGVYMSRTGGLNPMPGGMLPCKDGYVVIVVPQNHQWDALMTLMGNPHWSEEEWTRYPESRNRRTQEINERLIPWLMQHPMEEIFRKGQALGCPVSPVFSPEDQARSQQYKEREFFGENRHPVMGRTRFPTTPYRFSETPWRLARSAPLLGEHNDEIYGSRLGLTREELGSLKEAGVI